VDNFTGIDKIYISPQRNTGLVRILRDPKGFWKKRSFAIIRHVPSICSYAVRLLFRGSESFRHQQLPCRVISRLVRNLKFHYCFHKILPLALILSQFFSSHPSHLFKIHFNIIRTPKLCLPFRFTD